MPVLMIGKDRVIARLGRTKRKLEDSPSRAAHEAGDSMLDWLRRKAPFRTGRLRRGIRVHIRGRGEHVQAWFTSSASYTHLVIKGTRPHPIVAGFFQGTSRKKALQWPGQRHPTVRVFHPGTAPNNFPREAFHDARPGIRSKMRLIGRWIVGRV